jgi:formate dehydrogenase subunit delta
MAVRAASELALRWLASCEVTTRWSTLSQNGLDGTMDADNLVQMANRIGEFFEAMPDREEAQDGITGHIKRYWAPHMRQALLAHVNEGATDLMPIVAEAVHARAALLGARGSSSSACEQRDA